MDLILLRIDFFSYGCRAGSVDFARPGKRIKKLNPTIASVTLCAGAQATPATLAAEANVDMTSPVNLKLHHCLFLPFS